MKNAQLLIQMEIIYTLDTDLLDGAAAAITATTTASNGIHLSVCAQMQRYACV